jgi:hypothetical protein
MKGSGKEWETRKEQWQRTFCDVWTKTSDKQALHHITAPWDQHVSLLVRIIHQKKDNKSNEGGGEANDTLNGESRNPRITVFSRATYVRRSRFANFSLIRRRCSACPSCPHLRKWVPRNISETSRKAKFISSRKTHACSRVLALLRHACVTPHRKRMNLRLSVQYRWYCFELSILLKPLPMSYITTGLVLITCRLRLHARHEYAYRSTRPALSLNVTLRNWAIILD